MPITADRWMFDYPGLEPSQGQLRRDLDQLELETEQRISMSMDGVRSVLPSVPRWGSPPTYNKSQMEIHGIAGQIQQQGGNAHFYDYIKAVMEGKVWPCRRVEYKSPAHTGLNKFVDRLKFNNGKNRMSTYALQFSTVENGIVVRWLDNTVVLPFVELTDEKLNFDAPHENGIGVLCTQQGLYFPVDGRLYLSARKFLAQATLAIGQPWITGEIPNWQLFNADDPQTIERLGKLLGDQISLATNIETGYDFAEFFVDWYKEIPYYETNLKVLADIFKFIDMLELEDLPKLVADLESNNLLWRFADQPYGGFFYPDNDDTTDTRGIRDQFLAHYSAHRTASEKNSQTYSEGRQLVILELQPFINHDTNGLGFKIKPKLSGSQPVQLLQQPHYSQVDSLLVKQLNDNLRAFLGNYRGKAQPET